MAIPTMQDDLDIVSKLGDSPNTDNNLSSEQLKAKFDEGPKTIKAFINNTIVPALNKLVGAVGFMGTHGELTGREKPEQHPIAAISGLAEALEKKAPSDHNHTGVYAPSVHTHDYSPSDHNHDDSYLKVASGAVAMPLILQEGVHFGPTVPENPETGRLYFIPVSEAVNL